MCFFKKKKKKTTITTGKYKVGDKVNFKHRDDVAPGFINDIYFDDNSNIVYDIQIGGECPAIITGIDEDDIFFR